MGVYEYTYTYPLPPPFLERGVAELVLRRVTYVPLSGIKPSGSSVCAVSVSYSFGEIASDVLVALLFSAAVVCVDDFGSSLSEAFLEVI